MRVTDQNAFQIVRDVLSGTRQVPLDPRSAKVTHAITGSECDVQIATSLFAMSWIPAVRRRTEWYPRLAPAFVSDLMSAMGVKEILEPTVGVLEPGSLLRARSFQRTRCAAWIIPNFDDVEIRLRAIAADAHTDPIPIPAEGVWQLPTQAPPYRHVPVPKRYIANDARRACPHCSTVPARYREISDAWICEECGRSFKSH